MLARCWVMVGPRNKHAGVGGANAVGAVPDRAYTYEMLLQIDVCHVTHFSRNMPVEFLCYSCRTDLIWHFSCCNAASMKGVQINCHKYASFTNFHTSETDLKALRALGEVLRVRNVPVPVLYRYASRVTRAPCESQRPLCANLPAS